MRSLVSKLEYFIAIINIIIQEEDEIPNPPKTQDPNVLGWDVSCTMKSVNITAVFIQNEKYKRSHLFCTAFKFYDNP
jgi:tRNA(Ile2) C34 agmatinyltransferase TiaS